MTLLLLSELRDLLPAASQVLVELSHLALRGGQFLTHTVQ